MDYLNSIKNIDDGLLVVNRHGDVVLANNNFKAFVGVDSNDELTSFSKFLNETIRNSDNDVFCDFVVDCFLDKSSSIEKTIEYKRNNEKLYFRAHCSYDEKDENYYFTFTNITNVTLLQFKTKDSMIVAAFMIAGLSIWCFGVKLWDTIGQPIEANLLTIFITIGCGIIGYLTTKITHIDYKNMGLEFKGKEKAIITDAIVTLTIMLLMVAVKWRYFYDGTSPLIAWSLFKTKISLWYYPLTVFIQEIVSRGIMYVSIESVFEGKYKKPLAIIISSVAFGAVHIHLSLEYMVGATILLSLFGMVYNKQKSIWGLCIIHYFLSVTATLLGFI